MSSLPTVRPTIGLGFLAPQIDEDGAPFWAAAKQGELVMQACASCGRLRFPPRPMCPQCRSMKQVWRLMSGKGNIWSFVVPHPPLLPEFDALPGFNIVVVQLAEEPALRLAGNLVADAGAPINSVDPATILVGEPVAAVFPEVEPGVRVVRWVREAKGATRA